MPDYHYSYFVGALIFLTAWIVCYWLGKKYRFQMIWGSLMSAPFACTGFLFVPQYWTPPSLFDLDRRFGIGIEDVIWSAAVGGVATVLGEIVFRERLVENRKKGGRRHYAPFVAVALVFASLELLQPGKAVYNMIAAFLAGALLIALLRRDLIQQMFMGAFVFAVVYLSLFVYLLAIYPEFITRYYNLANLIGLKVLGVPIEEIMFALTGGAIWTVAYEFVHDYRVVSSVPFRLARVRDT